MLFPLSATTPQCQLFRVLNDELLHFLNSSVHAATFSEDLFSQYQHDGVAIRSVCWTNSPTREKFENLWNALPLNPQARQGLVELVNGAQNISTYFRDSTLPIAELPTGDLFDAFKSLTAHLFLSTKDVKSAIDEAGRSIREHYQDFKRENDNSQLCYLCGTARLSQDRMNSDDNDQWRADYDHLLCKDKYPIYSAHPGNFIPTCHICNSKAKGARNLLVCENHHRRLALYPLPPLQEACYQDSSVALELRTLAELIAGQWSDPLASAPVSFPNADADITPKIAVWVEVYEVPSRVEKEIVSNFFERISSDLKPEDFNDFCSQLNRHATGLPQDYKKAEWRFWWHRVYEFLAAQDEGFLRDVWSMIEWKLGLSNDVDMDITFGA